MEGNLRSEKNRGEKEGEVVRIDGRVNHGWKKGQIHANKIHTLKECIRFGGKNI